MAELNEGEIGEKATVAAGTARALAELVARSVDRGVPILVVAHDSGDVLSRELSAAGLRVTCSSEAQLTKAVFAEWVTACWEERESKRTLFGIERPRMPLPRNE